MKMKTTTNTGQNQKYSRKIGEENVKAIENHKTFF